MPIENTVSSDFDSRSSIVKSVFDCHLPGVIKSAVLVTQIILYILVAPKCLLWYTVPTHMKCCIM